MHERSTWYTRTSLAVGLSSAFLVAAFVAGCEQKAEAPAPTAEPLQRQEPPAAPSAQQAPQGAPGQPTQGAPSPAAPHANDAPPAPGEPTAQAKEPISDKQLDQFAEAFVKVVDVRKDLENQLAEADNDQQAKSLQESAVTQVRKHVESTGMSFETYTAISRRLADNPELQARLNKKIDAVGGG